MTDRECRAWLSIQENCRLAQQFVDGRTLAEFEENRQIFYAATRCLEIVSEAARRLRGQQQAGHPEIEWRAIEDSGNFFRHDYEGAEERRVWLTIADRVPSLLKVADAVVGAVQSIR